MRLKSLFVISILVLLLSVFVLPVIAASPNQDPQSPPIPEVVLLLIPILVGRLGVPLVNWAKKQLDLTHPEDKQKNVWLAFIVSAMLAVIALLITGSFVPLTGPNTIVTWVSLVFNTATLVYQSMQPKPAPEEPAGP